MALKFLQVLLIYYIF